MALASSQRGMAGNRHKLKANATCESAQSQSQIFGCSAALPSVLHICKSPAHNPRPTKTHSHKRFGNGANAPCNVANSNLFGVASKRALSSVAKELQSQQHVACHKQKNKKINVIKTEQQPQRQPSQHSVCSIHNPWQRQIKLISVKGTANRLQRCSCDADAGSAAGAKLLDCRNPL